MNMAAHKKTAWRSPESAPRDGEMFLGDMGFPWPMIVCWNKYYEKWVFVLQQASYCEGIEDMYFENEHAKANELKRWMPLPELPEENTHD
jgi:hypothetical protein